jgi:Holin of 3TMs, for gene-transfer release
MAFNVNTGIGQVADLATTVINKIWPDKSEQEKQELAAGLAMIQGQLEINRVEAGHQNLFVAGWRPFIGWVCGIALAYAALFEPVMRFIAKVSFGYTGEFPVIDHDITMQVLLGLLGLGAYRSWERVKGVVPPQR